MWQDFEVAVPGKWVLAGEHAVLRGATAIALPHPDAFLTLRFQAGGGEFTVSPGSAKAVLNDLLHSVRDKWENQDKSFPWPKGSLSLESSIPLGAGLGSSAALCVAVTRWLAPVLNLKENDFFEFARSLEHQFHGQSSGMDIAVALARQPIAYGVEKGAHSLVLRKLPRFTFHDTGLRSRTSDSIMKVLEIKSKFPILSMEIDQKMGALTGKLLQGLQLYSDRQDKDGQERAVRDWIAPNMNAAHSCFVDWGLVPSQITAQREELFEKGAVGVKLTGAGDGGFLVALWEG